MNERVYLYIMNQYERKLKECMGEEEFAKYATRIAKEAFRRELEGMANCDFKDFCLENFDMITR